MQRAIRGNLDKNEPLPTRGNYLKGKRVLVVGGTSGLGRAIADAAAKDAASVEVVGRSNPKDEKLKFYSADLTLVKNQTEAADAIPDPSQLDVVVFTNGIMTGPTLEETSDGIEKDLAVSYVSRRVILDRLRTRGLKTSARVFVMGFPGAEVKIENWNGKPKYEQFPQHMNTVVANDALVLGYRTRYPDYQVYGLNPGMVTTGIRDNIWKDKKLIGSAVENIMSWFTPSAKSYGESIVDKVINAQEISKSTIFFNQFGEPIQRSKYLSDSKNVEKVWEDTDKLIDQATNKQ
jgi:NAD(P)-dependent dehydrogenase (short-subunit alcohol dehydrogenase family)